MALIIEKFGGSSVADLEKIRAVACRIAETLRQGNQVVVVVSAQGKTTDGLLEKAGEISAAAPAREMDQLLACGEQMSAALCAMTLIEQGIDAVSLSAWQVGLFTDGAHQDAAPLALISSRLLRELAQGRVPVVTGFQGCDANGDVTTLGRGGSDTTAVFLAHALGADRCLFFKDVDGVYTEDPHKNREAKRLSSIGYDEMLSMAQNGAKVLHTRSVELAKRYGICMEILSGTAQSAGTVIK